MNVVQILFRDSDHYEQPLPASLEAATKSTQAAFADHHYQLFDLPAARNFISARFQSRVLDAFDTLKPYAFKSDLARY